MLVNNVGARIGFNQDDLREACLAEASTIIISVFVRPNVASGFTGFNTVRILPIRDRVLLPIVGFERERPECTSHSFGTFGRLAVMRVSTSSNQYG